MWKTHPNVIAMNFRLKCDFSKRNLTQNDDASRAIHYIFHNMKHTS